METNEDLAYQWRLLHETGQKIIGDINTLRLSLDNFFKEKHANCLLDQKKQFRQKLACLEREIGILTYAIKNREAVLADIKNPKETQFTDFIVREMRNCKSIRGLKKIVTRAAKAPKYHKQCSRMISNLKKLKVIDNFESLDNSQKSDMSIKEMEEKIRQENENDAHKIQRTNHAKDTILAHIDAIEEVFNQAKQDLKTKLADKKQEQQTHSKRVMEWITENLQRLTWVLTHQKIDRQLMVRRYQNRHPHEDVNHLLEKPVDLQTSQPGHVRRRKKGVTTSPELPVPAATEQKSWKFFLAFTLHGPKKELPQDQQGFSIQAKAMLGDAQYRRLDPKDIYQTLWSIAYERNMQQRQALTRMSDDRADGWQRKRLTSKYRLLLFIEEELGEITFIPLKKNERTYDF